MKIETKEFSLTNFQWFSVVFCTILGAGIITLPRTVADVAGRDSWISVIVAGGIICILATLIWLLCKRFPTKTLPEFAILILGRPLGIFASILYAFYAFVAAGIVLRIFVELVRTWVLIWTPAPVVILAILLPTVYISRMGATTLGRLMELVTMMTVVVLLLWLVPIGELNLLNLRPVGAEGLLAIVQGGQEATFSFLGFEVMLVFFPLMRNRNKVLHVTLLALGVITLLYAGNVALTHGVLGVEQTLLQQWPLMNYLRVGMLPFLKRVDSIVLFFWMAKILAGVAVQYFAGTFVLATLTGRNYHDIWALVCVPLVYIFSTLPENLATVVAISDLFSRGSVFGIMGLTMLLLVVAKVRGLDESKEEKQL